MGRRVGGLAAPHDLGVLAYTYGVYTRTSPVLTLSFPVDRLRNPTDAQRLFNDRSTDVQRTFNVCCLFLNGRWQSVQPTITHYPLPM